MKFTPQERRRAHVYFRGVPSAPQRSRNMPDTSLFTPEVVALADLSGDETGMGFSFGSIFHAIGSVVGWVADEWKFVFGLPSQIAYKIPGIGKIVEKVMPIAATLVSTLVGMPLVMQIAMSVARLIPTTLSREQLPRVGTQLKKVKIQPRTIYKDKKGEYWDAAGIHVNEYGIPMEDGDKVVQETTPLKEVQTKTFDIYTDGKGYYQNGAGMPCNEYGISYIRPLLAKKFKIQKDKKGYFWDAQSKPVTDCGLPVTRDYLTQAVDSPLIFADLSGLARNANGDLLKVTVKVLDKKTVLPIDHRILAAGKHLKDDVYRALDGSLVNESGNLVSLTVDAKVGDKLPAAPVLPLKSVNTEDYTIFTDGKGRYADGMGHIVNEYGLPVSVTGTVSPAAPVVEEPAMPAVPVVEQPVVTPTEAGFVEPTSGAGLLIGAGIALAILQSLGKRRR